MNNKQGLKRALALCYLLATSVSADQYSFYETPQAGALSWWGEHNNLMPPNYPQPWNGQQTSPFQHQAIPSVSPYNNAPSGYRAPPQQHYQPATYRAPKQKAVLTALKCKNLRHVEHAGHCILRSNANLTGLQEQIRYLKKTNLRKKAGGQWANVSNAALLETARALLDRETNHSSGSLNQNFSLYRIGSKNNDERSYFTGYFTPEIQVQSYQDNVYRYPIYGKPPRGTKLTRRQIDNGALQNRGLEIGWTNDLINLYFAHIQGSAIARYPDGKTRYLNYAANNGHAPRNIGRYLKKKNYANGDLSNANVSRWLHQHPEKIHEVLHQNPRYIFFNLAGNKTNTATGTTIIPGHTIAVDKNYIPLGSVLLAEIPRIDHRGKRTGSDWKMLFAQDSGGAIKGPGRIDLYTGVGDAAERQTYQLTGLHKTYLLVRKPGWNENNLANR